MRLVIAIAIVVFICALGALAWELWLICLGPQ
jgi:hypothetical protein